MAVVEDGIIKFPPSELKNIRAKCGNCIFGYNCRIDEKTSSATVNPSISVKPSDAEIASQASCLKKPEEKSSCL
jgi:hypothetical protein